MWYVYTVEYYPAVKKNEIMSFAAIWMVLEIVILSEGSQNDKEKYHAVTYKQNLKRNVTNELTYETEADS